MKNYLYTAWFENHALEKNDQDYEWPACFIVEATSIQLAQEWGDFLAIQYSKNNPNEKYLKSNIHFVSDLNSKETLTLPRVQYGENATDQKIAW